MTKIEKAQKSAEQIATKFSVPLSAVVWAGNNDFIVVNKGKEILIKNWRLLKAETIIKSDTEPDFWTCYNIANANGCEFFSVEAI